MLIESKLILPFHLFTREPLTTHETESRVRAPMAGTIPRLSLRRQGMQRACSRVASTRGAGERASEMDSLALAS